MPKQRLLLPPRVTSPHLFSFNFFLYNHPHSFYPLSNSTSSSFLLHIIHKTHQLTYSLLPPKMADRQSGPRRGSGGATQASTNNLLRKLHDHAPNSSQLIGFLTLTISGAILLVLTGLTITATILGVIFFTPLILLSSPIWVPVGVVIFIAIAGFLSMCAFGLALLGGSSWLYKYLRGWHPPGSDRVDYARSRIAESASHVKDYAKEYGGYLQGKVKDAAPSA